MALTKAFAVFAGNDSSGTALTTGTFDSTGYTHVVLFEKHEGASTTLTSSDNKSSSFSNLTSVSHANGDLHCRMSWAPIGSPGTGHTVTITFGASRPYRRLGVWLINATGGAIQVDAEATASGTSTTPDGGSLVTTAATVSFMGVGEYNSTTWSAGSGWTADWNNPSGYVSFGQSRSDASSGTLDPVCTCGSMAWVVSSVSFKESGGAAGQSHRLMMTGVGF